MSIKDHRKVTRHRKIVQGYDVGRGLRRAPVVVLSATSVPAATGQEVTVDASESYSPDGKSISFSIDKVDEPSSATTNLDSNGVFRFRSSGSGVFTYRIGVSDDQFTRWAAFTITVGTESDMVAVTEFEVVAETVAKAEDVDIQADTDFDVSEVDVFSTQSSDIQSGVSFKTHQAYVLLDADPDDMSMSSGITVASTEVRAGHPVPLTSEFSLEIEGELDVWSEVDVDLDATTDIDTQSFVASFADPEGISTSTQLEGEAEPIAKAFPEFEASSSLDTGVNVLSVVSSNMAMTSDLTPRLYDTVWALSARDSTVAKIEDVEIWSETFSQVGGRSIAVDREDYAYVTGTRDELLRINPDGTLDWHIEMEDNDLIYPTSVAVDDSQVYVGSANSGADNKVRCYDKQGNFQWEYGPTTNEIGIRSLVSDNNGSLYVGFAGDTDDTLRCLDTSNGSEIWGTRDLGTSIYGISLDREGKIFVLDRNTRLYGADLQSTSPPIEDWSVALTTNANHEDMVYDGNGSLVTGGEHFDYMVQKFSADNGTLEWTFGRGETSNGVKSVAVSSRRGWIYAANWGSTGADREEIIRLESDGTQNTEEVWPYDLNDRAQGVATHLGRFSTFGHMNKGGDGEGGDQEADDDVYLNQSSELSVTNMDVPIEDIEAESHPEVFSEFEVAGVQVKDTEMGTEQDIYLTQSANLNV